MKSKLQNYLTAGIMALCVMLSMSACHDSDDDTQETKNDWGMVNQKLSEDRVAAARLLCMLTGQEFVDTIDVDIENRIFKPNYGSVSDDSKPTERCLKVVDAEAAEMLFRMLNGGNENYIKETADGCIIDMTNLNTEKEGTKLNLGKLTYHRAESEKDEYVGYADVEIACIPQLQRIVYKNELQWGKNSFWTSPCKQGEVFTNGGRYFICVRESQGYNWPSERGVLICMEPGKGTSWCGIYSDEEAWGAWRPKSQILPGAFADALLDYLRLSAGAGRFARTKKRILAQPFGQKVFPCGNRFNWDGNEDHHYTESLGIPGNGFDTLEEDYSHWAGTESYSDSENSHSDCDNSVWGNGGNVYAIIARDATEGEWYGAILGWERRLDYLALPYRCKGSLRASFGRCCYFKNNNYGSALSNTSAWFDRFLGGKLVYTCRGVDFSDNVPDGFALVDI